MAKNVFISFRFSDGRNYKEYLSKLFDADYYTVDYSEDVNRSYCSERTIKDYLYKKLRRSSITIILLTPNVINHQKNSFGDYDDWMYDEIRYSLEDRDGNRTNGLIAVYTPEAENYLIERHAGFTSVLNVDNLFRRNMMNVRPAYKKCFTYGLYDGDYDSYCSLISFDEFVRNIDKYISIASKKRDELYKYEIIARM